MPVLRIKIPKANTTLDVDLDNVSDYMYAKLMEEGLKSYLNRRMAKLKGKPKNQTAVIALEIAKENLLKLYDNTSPLARHEIPKLSACNPK